jgi:hypothetical protein
MAHAFLASVQIWVHTVHRSMIGAFDDLLNRVRQDCDGHRNGHGIEDRPVIKSFYRLANPSSTNTIRANVCHNRVN